MNRRNFLSVLALLPFVRLDAPLIEVRSQVVNREPPASVRRSGAPLTKASGRIL